MINLCTNKLHLSRLRAVVPMHRTPGGHRTIDVTTGLTPVTFRVPEEIPQQYGMTWDQFVTGHHRLRTLLETLGINFWRKDETENVSRSAESIDKQRGETSQDRQFTHHHIRARSQSATRTRLSDKTTIILHLTDSHFSQDDKERDNPSSSSHDTRPFPLSDAITSVDLTTWGPNVRCHNQGGRSMGLD